MYNLNKNGIDLPVQTQLAYLPYLNNYHSSGMETDGKRFIYHIPGYGQAAFYRYDTTSDTWQTLASLPVAPSTSGYSSDLAYDYSKNRIYAIIGGSSNFYYYDIEGNTWSVALAALPVMADAGAKIVHTCSYVDPTANDDYIYYIPANGSSRKLYRYSISGNAWTEMGTDIIPAAPSYGAGMYWGGLENPDIIYIIRGLATRTYYEYKISTNSCSVALAFFGTTGVVGNGTIHGYDKKTGQLFWVESGTKNILKSHLRAEPFYKDVSVTSATSSTITANSLDLDTDDYFKNHIIIKSGTGAGQVREIKSNTDKTITVYPNFTITPDATSVFDIVGYALDYGDVASATNNTATITGKNWIFNIYSGGRIVILSGTGAGQTREIVSHTGSVITISQNWTVNPDATSKMVIIGARTKPEGNILFGTSVSYYGNSMVALNIKDILFVYYSRKNTTAGEWFRFSSITK